MVEAEDDWSTHSVVEASIGGVFQISVVVGAWAVELYSAHTAH